MSVSQKLKELQNKMQNLIVNLEGCMKSAEAMAIELDKLGQAVEAETNQK